MLWRTRRAYTDIEYVDVDGDRLIIHFETGLDLTIHFTGRQTLAAVLHWFQSRSIRLGHNAEQLNRHSSQL